MSILNPARSAGLAPVPTLKSALKRKRADQDVTSDDAAPSSQSQDSKRPRLDFKSEVQTIFYDPSGEDSAAFVQASVKMALKNHMMGNDDEYNRIKAIFMEAPSSPEAVSATLLQKHLLGLSNSASSLTRQCSDLVHAIIDMQWLDCDDRTVSIYVRFLGSLVSSQSGWIGPVLRMLVGNFAGTSASAGRASTAQQNDRETLQDRIHESMRYLINLVPSASGSLASILSNSFPSPTDSRRAHVDYVKNSLRLTDNIREVKADVLDLVTERLIKIDVQVQIDVEDLDDMVGDLLVQGGLDEGKTFEDDDDSDTESMSSEESLDPEEERIEALKGAVQKMDSIMDILFAYYTPSFEKASQFDSRRIFHQMLSQFRKTVLPTYRSRHTQFLLFHFAQRSPDLVASFVDSCLQVLKDKAQPSIIRLSSAAYIASFVARGSHVTADTVTFVFDSLAAYADKLRREHEPDCRGPDLRRYSAYYATVQALIYIFCFRWRDLLYDPEDFEADEDELDHRDLEWAPGVKDAFEQNFGSKLNPLKICVPEIVDQFARIARHLRFLYIHHIIELNKRLRLTASVAATAGRETALSGLHGERYHQLDAYFPFDPYQLPLSKRWLAADYNEWKGVPGLMDPASAPAPYHEGRRDAVADSSDEDDGGMTDDEADLIDEGTETPDDDNDDA